MTNYLSRYPYALSGRFDHIDATRDTLICNMRASSEMRETLLNSLEVDRSRARREFMTPEPNSAGFYWPKEAMTGHLERATSHIPYLCRPIFNYKIPSKYGYSKYVTVRKL